MPAYRFFSQNDSNNYFPISYFETILLSICIEVFMTNY